MRMRMARGTLQLVLVLVLAPVLALGRVECL